jgi:hypothetical protein
VCVLWHTPGGSGLAFVFFAKHKVCQALLRDRSQPLSVFNHAGFYLCIYPVTLQFLVISETKRTAEIIMGMQAMAGSFAIPNR